MPLTATHPKYSAMLFHTWIFLVFFVIVYSGYLLLKGTRFKLPWLLAASYIFYGCWSPVYLLLIIWSTTVDFLAVLAMAKTRWRKPWLALSIVNNLGMLAFFKYGSFVVDNANAVAERLGLPFAVSEPNVTFLSDSVNGLLSLLHVSYEVPALNYLLPVGISFYVFQSMSYTIDFYRGQIKREPSFIRYATFVSLFPQLVAGPIERASNLLPQLHGVPRVTREDVSDGLSLVRRGAVQENRLGRLPGVVRHPGLRQTRRVPGSRTGVGHVRLRLADLF